MKIDKDQYIAGSRQHVGTHHNLSIAIVRVLFSPAAIQKLMKNHFSNKNNVSVSENAKIPDVFSIYTYDDDIYFYFFVLKHFCTAQFIALRHCKDMPRHLVDCQSTERGLLVLLPLV